MSTLSGTKIKDTYSGLLKTTDNAALSGTFKNITDGAGNASGLDVNSTEVRANTGILFGTDTAEANKLDDYEEGTFTPSFSPASGSVVHSGNTGVYTKIGNSVTITVALSLTSVSSPSGNLNITGLPFTAISGEAGNAAITIALARTFTDNFAELRGYVIKSTTIVALVKNATNAGGQSVTADKLQAGTLFYFTASYKSI